jgi:hypothetical protein
MSHEGILYCKPHHRELLQPKVVQSDIVDVSGKKSNSKSAARPAAKPAVEEEKAAAPGAEVVVENEPEQLEEGVVRSSTAAASEQEKFQGLENLDVGAKFKMFESGGEEKKKTSSDRYGIMEKLRRLQVCRIERSPHSSFPHELLLLIFRVDRQIRRVVDT